MIGKIVDFCLRERIVVLAGAVLLVGYGWYAFHSVPIDAIPDVSEKQVIVLTEWPGRSPKDVEDQITYPLSIALQATPGAKSVRGKSMFGYSFIQVTFADHVDLYWARSRVAEKLLTVSAMLPEGVRPALGPDATALGQIFYYVLQPPEGMDLAEVRSIQDFHIKYALQSVEGVAEVASIGGYQRQYQIEVDPDKLRFHQIPLSQLLEAVRASNIDVGAKTVETSGMEYLVRGKGFIGSGKTLAQTIQEIEQTVILTRHGVPVRVKDVAQVQVGPAFRDGALDWNGQEAVGGVVVMRFGENPRQVIQRVKEKIASLEPELKGIRILPVYDRTLLIDETVATLTDALWKETVITIAVVVLGLLHLRASLSIAVTLPMAVLMAFIAMKLFGVDGNIMSLAGIAIAIGTMVDMGIIVLENIYAHLAAWESQGSPGGNQRRLKLIHSAAVEVAPAVITAISTTIVSFLPVFFLTGRDHKLFAPLAWTKTFGLAASLIVAVTVVPVLSALFLHSGRRRMATSILAGVAAASFSAAIWYYLWANQIIYTTSLDPTMAAGIAAGIGFWAGWWISRERLRSLEDNPITRLLLWFYGGRLRLALHYKAAMLSLPLMLLILGLGAWIGLPTVLRPLEAFCRFLGADLNQLPGYVSAKHLLPGLKTDDWIALDEGSWFYMPSMYPAVSFSQAMQVLQTQNTLIKQIPEVENVLGKIGRVQSALDPAPVAMVETYVILKPPDQWRPGMTMQKIWDEINSLATLVGVTPASALQPIEGRVVMLQAGIRAPMAVRIYGDSLEGLAHAALAVAHQLRKHPWVDPATVNPDIVTGKPYLEFEVDRQEAARYGMSTMMVNQIISAGLGGLDVTTTVEGRQRYPIQIRYQRNLREQLEQLGRVPVVTETGQVVPLERLARMSTTWGPPMINSEDARLVAHVPFAPSGAAGDLETVEAVMHSLQTARQNGELVFPPGHFELVPVGSFQNQIEANRRLLWIIPTVIGINFFLLYLHFRKVALAMLVFSGIPVAAAGGMIALAIAQVKMNTAVWVGFIALFGIAADDGVVMATYIQQLLSGRTIRTVPDIRQAVYEAGLKRIRPCVMTTLTTLIALLPVLLSTGRGADVARAMAIPIFGGMLVEPFTTFIVPTLYCAYLEFKKRAGFTDPSWSPPEQNLSPDQQPDPAATSSPL